MTNVATSSLQPESPVQPDAGFTLIETMIALLILAIVAAGVLPLGLVASSTSENQGHLMARTSEYAQDKLEQLLSLSYGNSTSDTRLFPAPELGGSGLTPGGSANPAAPVNLYVDYLDERGNLFPPAAGAPANWFYMRVWQVAEPQLNLKLITVTTTVRVASHGGIGRVPTATVATFKTFPF